MRARSWASHIAHLDDMTGIGMLVMPNDDFDLSLGGMWTLHTAGQDHAIGELLADGWEPLADEYGGFFYDARTTGTGNRVISLSSRNRVISEPTLEEDQNAIDTLAVACGLMLTRELGA